MDFFQYKFSRNHLSVYCVVFVHSWNWFKTRSWDYSIQVDFYHFTHITSAWDFGEFLSTFRYAATKYIWKYVLLIILVTYRDNFLSLIFMNIFHSIVCCVVGSAPKYLVFYQSDNFENSHGHLPMGKNSHVQFWFVDFWVDVQRGTLSFVFVCTRNKIPAQTSHEVLTVDS